MKKLDILLLEDNPYDAELIEIEIQSEFRDNYTLTRVDTREKFLQQIITSPPDIILSDFRLPQYDGLKALNDVLAINPSLPFIIVTGSLSEEMAADSIKAGAWDYVVKERLFRLPAAMKNALSLRLERVENQKAAERLRTLSGAVENAPVAIMITDNSGNLEYVNPTFERLTGYTQAEVIGKNPRILKSDEHSESFYRELWDTILSGKIWSGKFKNLRKDKTPFWVSATISSIHDEEGKIKHFVGIQEDITAMMEAQQRLVESEKRYQLLADAAIEAIIITEDGLCKTVNRAATELFGYSLDEVAGKPLFSFFHNVQRDQLPQNLKKCEEKPFEMEGRRKDGSTFFCEVSSRKTIQDGTTLRITSIRDITERKLAQNALLRSERKYRELIENQGEGIILADENETINFANPAAEVIFGVGKNELLGKSLADFVVPDNIQALEKQKLIRRKGEKSSYELTILRPDGEEKVLLVTAVPRVDDNGKVTGSFGIFRDITDRKKMIEQLKEAKEKAEESDRMKSLFLQNLSHEIRTPMNGILGFAEILNDPDLPPKERKEYSSLIVTSTRKLLEIIQGILEVSKLEAKKTNVQIRPVDLNVVTRNLLKQYESAAKEKGLSIEYLPGLPEGEAMVMTDDMKVRQIIGSLLDNAIKFSERGVVRFGYNLNGEKFEVYVKDEGIGIPPEYHEKIFERFWQVEQGTTRKFGGTGIGLSIARGLTEVLGGHISLDTAPGRGSEFRVELPYEPVPVSRPKENRRDPLATDPSGNLVQKVLIAEDEDINYLVLEAILKSSPIKLLHARNGKEAVEIARREKPAVILMDIKMPVMDGITAAEKIREFDREVPIIAHSAYINSVEAEMARKTGFTDFLAKPVSAEQVLKLFAHYLNIKDKQLINI
ncbi:MAG: hypothetical protein Kow00127_00220 [Bacteroidales bacterium]